MKNRIPVNEYEIWIGSYHLGQGYYPPDKPSMVAKIKAQTFPIACLKYELETMMDSIKRREEAGEYHDHQSCRWWYDFDKNSNGWMGKYYETEQAAWQSFPEHKRPNNGNTMENNGHSS